MKLKKIPFPTKRTNTSQLFTYKELQSFNKGNLKVTTLCLTAMDRAEAEIAFNFNLNVQLLSILMFHLTKRKNFGFLLNRQKLTGNLSYTNTNAFLSDNLSGFYFVYCLLAQILFLYFTYLENKIDEKNIEVELQKLGLEMLHNVECNRNRCERQIEAEK